MQEHPSISERSKAALLRMQTGELTEHYIYSRVAETLPEGHNRSLLMQIAAEELQHSHVWEKYTGSAAKPNRLKLWWYTLLARILGFTFVLKLMESGEDAAGQSYAALAVEVPEATQIAADEAEHEAALLEMLDEERLRYVGSMVLGLNDALVELTGTLAGLTFAMQSTKLVALSGIITGISATFSMASSEYLSAKSEGRDDAFKSCFYTGVMYIVAVIILVLPYLLLPDAAYVPALLAMLVSVVLMILAFTFYISVAKGLDFKSRFREMVTISLSVAAGSFVVGLLAKQFLGIDA